MQEQIGCVQMDGKNRGNSVYAAGIYAERNGETDFLVHTVFGSYIQTIRKYFKVNPSFPKHIYKMQLPAF